MIHLSALIRDIPKENNFFALLLLYIGMIYAISTLALVHDDLLTNTTKLCTSLEVNMTGQYTLKSNVYGFGVLMLELFAWHKPFDRYDITGLGYLCINDHRCDGVNVCVVVLSLSEQSIVQWATPQLTGINVLGKMVYPTLPSTCPLALCVQVGHHLLPHTDSL
jgi:hypothetical protein